MLSLPNDPLPVGLVQGYSKDGAPRVVYDTRLGFGEECAEAASEKLRAAGLTEIQYMLQDSTVNRYSSDEIREVFKCTIEDSQAFQFIKTLASGGLAQEKEDQPLTPFWRMIRETQATHAVRERWGLETHEAVKPRTEPDYDLRREHARLDDETMPTPSSPESEPLVRLRSYLEQALQAAVREEKPEETFIEFGRDIDGDRVVRTTKAPEGYYDDELQELIQAAAHKLALQISEVAPYVQLMTEEYIYYLMEGVIWPEGDLTDFTQLSQRAIDVALWLEKPLAKARIFSAGDYATEGRHPAAFFHAGLLSPSSSYIDLSRLKKDDSDEHEHYSGSPENPRACINTPLDMPIGEVIHVSPDGRGPHAHRLIQSEPRRALPSVSGSEELLIRLFGQEFEDAQPYIPGYRLAGRTESTYGFVRDEKGDPYASADVTLTPGQGHMLARRYTDAGLLELAQAIQQSPALTVQGLTSLIANRSIYPTPQEARLATPPLSPYVSTKKLGNFQQLVRSGRLYVQCTGAAQLLRLSLEEIFGKGSAAVTEGYKLSRRTISTSSSHEQTVFTHKGQTYLLDATPSSSSGVTHNDYLFSSRHMRFGRRSSMPLNLMRTIRIDPGILELADSIELRQSDLHEQKMLSLRQSFDTQLASLLQVPDRDAAYDMINKLSEHDPFSRTLHAVLRASYNEATREDIEQLGQYLRSYDQADESLRSQMNLPSYDTPTIRLLRNTVEQLLTLV